MCAVVFSFLCFFFCYLWSGRYSYETVFLCMWLEGVVISIAEKELARLLISVAGMFSVMEYEHRESLSYIMYREKRNFAL